MNVLISGIFCTESKVSALCSLLAHRGDSELSGGWDHQQKTQRKCSCPKIPQIGKKPKVWLICTCLVRNRADLRWGMRISQDFWNNSSFVEHSARQPCRSDGMFMATQLTAMGYNDSSHVGLKVQSVLFLFMILLFHWFSCWEVSPLQGSGVGIAVSREKKNAALSHSGYFPNLWVSSYCKHSLQ